MKIRRRLRQGEAKRRLRATRGKRRMDSRSHGSSPPTLACATQEWHRKTAEPSQNQSVHEVVGNVNKYNVQRRQLSPPAVGCAATRAERTHVIACSEDLVEVSRSSIDGRLLDGLGEQARGGDMSGRSAPLSVVRSGQAVMMPPASYAGRQLPFILGRPSNTRTAATPYWESATRCHPSQFPSRRHERTHAVDDSDGVPVLLEEGDGGRRAKDAAAADEDRLCGHHSG
jgi:hypothetical protein